MLKSLLTFDEDVTKDECGIKWTKINEPTISHDIYKFGGGSFYGLRTGIYTNDLVSFTKNNSFTIELWYYWPGKWEVPRWADCPIFSILSDNSHFNGVNIHVIARGGYNHIDFGCSDSSNESDITCPSKKFFHIAVCFDRSAKKATLFEDGIKSVEASYEYVYNALTTIKIGVPYNDGNINDYVNNGYIDEFMITSGIKYTKDFIPPSAPTRFDKIAFLTKGNQLYARN